MRKTILSLTGSVMAALAVPCFAATGASAASSRSTCTAGVRTVGGAVERTFCGPATVVFAINGKQFKLNQGNCVAKPTYITVNIGVWTAQRTGPKPDYFGLNVGAVPGTGSPPAGKDGTYNAGITLALNHGGKSYAVDSLISPTTATLWAGRTRGSVKGKALTGETVSATFHC
jgi:hypothetical protein